MSFKKLKEIKGMSLIEMLIVTGILGFISLVVASTFSDIFKFQTQVVARDEVNEFASSVGRFLFSETMCSQALTGQAFPSVAGQSANLRLTGYSGFGAGSGSTSVEKNTQIGTRLRVNDLSVRNKGIAPQDVLANGVTLRRYVAQINLGLEVLDDGQWRPSSPRTFEMPLLVDPATNQIRRCYIEMKVDDACQVLGTTFDSTTGRCVPMSQCLFEGHYTTNNCNRPAHCPAGIANDLTGSLSCPSGSATSKETGVYEWSFTRSCGKKCTQQINVTTRYYVCLKCN